MKTKLLAFHGKQEIKEKYIARVKAHAEADEIIKGKYWENGKGCAVGCTIEGDDHDRYETELGIPSQIAHLEDALFEELPNDLAMTFPLRFLEAIPVGADLSTVVPQLVIWQFEDKEYGLKNIKEVKEDTETYGLCEEVVSLYKRELGDEKPSQEEYQKLYVKIDRVGAWAWAREWAREGVWARVGVWARAWADYEQAIVAASDQLLTLLRETNTTKD